MDKTPIKRLTLLLVILSFISSGQAQITAQQAILAMERGINLGNTLDAPNEGEWAGKAQEYYFEMYKEAGFKTVRIPITWGNHLSSTSPYAINATFLNRVEEIIDWGLERDLFVIINAHHDSWIKDDYAGQKARFDSLWVQISDRFKDKSEKLFFEILNEPHGAITAAQVDELNKRVLGIIRKTNPTRNVIYSGAGWSNSPDLLKAAIPDTADNYLMGYFHSYDPWAFAGESKGTWGTTSDIQAMKSKFDGVQTWSEQNNIPVLIGEFGAMYNCDYNSRMFYYATYVEQALAHGFAFTTWDDDGWFQVLKRKDAKWNDLKDILIHTSDSSITGLKLKTVDDTAIQLNWTNRANAELVQKIVIEKRLQNTNFVAIAELSQTSTTSYIDRNTTAFDYSYYRVVDVYSDDTIPSYPANIFRIGTYRAPYSDSIVTIPGIVEAENYDIGGELLTYHDIDFVNQGGVYRTDGVDIKKASAFYYVYNVELGEWLEYTINVAKAGKYNVTAYLGSIAGGGKMQLAFGSIKTPLITAPKTNSSTVLQPVTVAVDLQQGVQIMRLNIKAIPTFSIDKLEFSEYVSIADRSLNDLSIYPNPVSDKLEVCNSGLSIQNIRIFNSLGQLVITRNTNAEREIIDVSDLESGIYLIISEGNAGYSRANFIKQ